MEKTAVKEETKLYLETIDSVIQKGIYKDNWDSLSHHPVPSWYTEGKFGIFIHWGVYSVPAFGNEWYPRNMYFTGSREFEHHLATYGEHKDFGYKDFIPMFTANDFDATKWMELFKKSGAKFIVPVAEHHDGFQMYDSKLSCWNAKNMGPKKDVLGELKEAAKQQGIEFCASSHRAEHFFFLNGGRTFESDINDPAFEDFYGPAHWCEELNNNNSATTTQDIHSTPPTEEFLEDWLARTCELIDQYQPSLIYFDWWIQNVAFKPYLKKFAAYYYNRALEWKKEVTINYKFNAFGYTCGVFDIERGALSNISPLPWQADTAIAKNSWGYTTDNEFKTAPFILCDLIDTVSKNGMMLLNIGPKPDGTITEEETEVLLQIGKWLMVNGEGIYHTTYWKVYGEGDTKVMEGHFTDNDRAEYTESDFRFTFRGDAVYAFQLKAPSTQTVTIKTFRTTSNDLHIKAVSLLGSDDIISFHRTEEGLILQLPYEIHTEYPICYKIEIE